MPALRRRGFTLVELLIVLVVGGTVAAAATRLLQRQQRFYTSAGSLVMQRASLRDATGIIPGDIRALSAVDGDIIAFSDSSIEMRATIGSAIACDTVAGGAALHLAPDRVSDATASVFAWSSPERRTTRRSPSFRRRGMSPSKSGRTRSAYSMIPAA